MAATPAEQRRSAGTRPGDPAAAQKGGNLETALADALLWSLRHGAAVAGALFLLPAMGLALCLVYVWRPLRPRLAWWLLALFAAVPPLIGWLFGLRPETYLTLQTGAGAALLRPVLAGGEAVTGAEIAAWTGEALRYGAVLGLPLAVLALLLTPTIPEATPVATETHPEPPVFREHVDDLAEKGAIPGKLPGRLDRLRAAEALPARLRKPLPVTLRLAWDATGAPVALVDAEAGYHGVVWGMTGTGKTTLMVELVAEARRLGWPVVCIDLKGSPALRRLFRALPGGLVWTGEAPPGLDLLRGHPDEVAAKLVTVAGTSTGVQYNQISQGALTALVKELDRAGTPRTFPAIQDLLTRETAETREHKPHPALVDMAARLRVVTESSAEPWLRPGPASLSLEEAIRDGRAVLFSVPVPRLKLVGEKLGAWLLAEANRVANVLTADDWGRRGGRRCLILVDEFARLKEQGAHIVEPLAGVREGGVSVWLFTQTWSDLERLGDDVLPQILGNCAVQVAFRQGEAHDQERLSAQLGEYRTQAFTRSLDGETAEATGNYRVKDVAARYVTPGQIAGLEVGQAWVKIGTRRPVAVRFPKLEAPAPTQEAGPAAGAAEGEPPVEDAAPSPSPALPTTGGAAQSGGLTRDPDQAPPQESGAAHTPGQRPGASPDPFSLVD